MRSKSAWFIIAVSFLIVLSVPGNIVADNFSNHLNKAIEFNSKGEFEGAIAEYQKALRAKPNSIWAESRLGIAYEELGDRLFNNGETGRAIEAYKHALTAIPEDPYWHEQLGKALEKKGDHEAAIKEYHTATQILPLDGGLQRRYEKLISGPQGSVDENSNKAQNMESSDHVVGKLSAPVATFKPDPPYTERARQAKLEGTLTVWAVVDREGNVADTTIVKPLGLGLDARALESIRTWKFRPAARDGTPIPVRVMIEVSFRLH